LHLAPVAPASLLAFLLFRPMATAHLRLPNAAQRILQILGAILSFFRINSYKIVRKC
jgi:hypothetical protein